MKCDNCGRPTDKNYFTDDLTVLCADCAASGQFMSGDAAKRFIQNKCDANKPNKYKIDTGKTITHVPQDGVITLTHMMLDTITEVKRNAND